MSNKETISSIAISNKRKKSLSQEELERIYHLIHGKCIFEVVKKNGFLKENEFPEEISFEDFIKLEEREMNDYYYCQTSQGRMITKDQAYLEWIEKHGKECSAHLHHYFIIEGHERINKKPSEFCGRCKRSQANQ